MVITRIVKKTYDFIKMCSLIEKWRRRNKDNYTTLGNYFNIDCVSVGRKTYGEINVLTNNSKYRLRIGSFCSIAPNVMFILASDHEMHTFSTYPFKVKCAYSTVHEAISKGDIHIDDDVWIGYGAVILSGVHIGQGAVVAAGSLVSKDVPPYAVAAGVPAKVIKYRFEEPVISILLKTDFNAFSDEFIRQNMGQIYKKISVPDDLEWLPEIRKERKECIL